MIGQQKLVAAFECKNSWDVTHPLLLIGERGSEQVDFCRFLAQKFNFDYFDITGNFSKDMLESLKDISYHTIISIDIDEVNMDTLLKTLEDSSACLHFVLFAEHSNFVSEAIKNRCEVYTLETYSIEQLKLVTTNDKLLALCSNPGQILTASHMDYSALMTNVGKLIQALNTASYDNLLSIATKIDYGNGGLYDLTIFIKALKRGLLDNITPLKIKYYASVQKFYNTYTIYNDKKTAFENLLTELWSIDHAD